MDEKKLERMEEEKRVGKVMQVIRENMEELEERMGGIKEQVVDIRKHFWDDITVALDDPDDVIESHATLKQAAELLAERERSHRHAAAQYDKLRRLRQSPYFGRIDFREAGAEKAEPIYLGVGSLLDKDGDDFLVYDWRAPVSSLYYDYGPGPAEYETPSGTISGTMDLKRQFVFRDGELVYLFDTGITIGDELLQQVLGEGADAKMKNIVATIQRDQNRMIRSDRKRMLVVSGPAGSGKTSAALQRAAYLLYKYRGTLTADQIVLFSPNPMFNRYIATVLPELGEDNMEQTTLPEYLEHRLAGRFQLEDPYEQMEYVLTAADSPEYDARTDGISFKSSEAFLHLVLKYKQSLERGGLVFRNIKLRGTVIVSAEQIAEKFYAQDHTQKLAPRIDALVQWLGEKLESAASQTVNEPWVEQEVELLDEEEYLRVYKRLQKEQRTRRGAFNERQRESELLREMVVRRHMQRLQEGIKRLRFINVPATYRKLFENPELAAELIGSSRLPSRWNDICAETAERLARNELGYEDAAPYLYLQESIEGLQMNMHVRYVFIDEAQDYSPFQFQFLKRLFPRARMTVLGDPNQAINAHSSLPDFEGLSELYGPENTEFIRFTRTYRSTRPIVEFTRTMLKDGGDIEPFSREGELPTVKAASDTAELNALVAERMNALRREGFSTVAVLCKTERESREAFEALQRLSSEPIRLITRETAAFEPGIVVIPSYLAKGIEFDAVILYDASRAKYGRETERRLFYTACTRAMHRLHLYYVGEPSPFVESADPGTYVLE